MYAKVFKVGNGNNQHGRPFPTKGGHAGDGSKAHAALGVTPSLAVSVGDMKKSKPTGMKAKIANAKRQRSLIESGDRATFQKEFPKSDFDEAAKFMGIKPAKKTGEGWAADLGLV